MCASPWCPAAQLLYSLWFADPSYALFIAPPFDAQLVSLTPLLQAYNRTVLNFGAGDPADFLPHYPYIFSELSTYDLTGNPTFDRVNEAALALNLAEGSDSGDSSIPVGIRSVCLYAQPDSDVLLMYEGTHAWINATNEARLSQGASSDDLVELLVDVLLPATTLTDSDSTAVYTAALNECPDGVDLLVVLVQFELSDWEQITAAVAATELRPKAAYSNANAGLLNLSNSVELRDWPGWLLPGGTPTPVATLPGVTFPSAGEAMASYSGYFGEAPTVFFLLVATMFEIMTAGLSVSASLSSEELRAAYLSLNGTTFLGDVQLDPLTGINVALNGNPVQMVADSPSPRPIDSSRDLLFPYDWPWHRLEAGDALSISLEPSSVLLSLVLCVLGCWVGQILLEQTLWLRRKGGAYVPWLCMAAFALGAVGVVSAQLELATAAVWNGPLTTGADSALTVKYSLPLVLLTMALPGFVGCFLGLLLIVRDVAVTGGGALARDTADRVEKADVMASGCIGQAQHLRERVTWTFAWGCLTLCASIWLCRTLLLYYLWQMTASARISPGGFVVSCALTLALLSPSLLLYCHGQRYRLLGVFALVMMVYLDFLANLLLSDTTYQPVPVQWQEAAQWLYGAVLPQWGLQLFTGITAAGSVVIFVGLQFDRMHLSRKGLRTLVERMERTVAALELRNAQLADDLSAVRGHADELVRVVEFITLMRPAGKDFALPLAQYATAATALDLVTRAAIEERDSGAAHRSSTADEAAQSARASYAAASGGGSVPHSSRSAKSEANDGRTREKERAEEELTSPHEARAVVGTGAAALAVGAQEARGSHSRLLPILGRLRPRLSLVHPAGTEATTAAGVGARVEVGVTGAGSQHEVSASNGAMDGLHQAGNDEDGAPPTPAVAALPLPAPLPRALLFRTASSSSASSVPASRASSLSAAAATNRPETPQFDSNRSMSAAQVSAVDGLPRGSGSGSGSGSGGSMMGDRAVGPSVGAPSLLQRLRGRGAGADLASRVRAFEVKALASLTGQRDEEAEGEEPVLGAATSGRSVLRGAVSPPTASRTLLSPQLRMRQLADAALAHGLGANLFGRALAQQRERSRTEEGTLAGSLPTAAPTLRQLLQHPVCVELLKDELLRSQSLECLSFYLLAFRYRGLRSSKLRRALAGRLYDAFVAEGSEQQINLSTRQREAISAVVAAQREDDFGQAAPAHLFLDAEREMLQLIDTNAFKPFTERPVYQLALWSYHAVRWQPALLVLATTDGHGSGHGPRSATLADGSRTSKTVSAASKDREEREADSRL